MTENEPVSLDDALAKLRAKMEEDRGAPVPVEATVIEPGVCYWCGKDCGGTCLGVNHEGGPRQMKTSDPAYWMLKDGHTSTPQVYRDGCYICSDVEFAAMGLPLCKPCPQCTAEYKAENPAEVAAGINLARGHIPADDVVCDDCGYNEWEAYGEEVERQKREQA